MVRLRMAVAPEPFRICGTARRFDVRIVDNAGARIYLDLTAIVHGMRDGIDLAPRGNAFLALRSRSACSACAVAAATCGVCFVSGEVTS
jgi:hypothetical protein